MLTTIIYRSIRACASGSTHRETKDHHDKPNYQKYIPKRPKKLWFSMLDSTQTTTGLQKAKARSIN
jgi:hypothetical protein